uniref:Putative c-type lectin n=1 Tax=Lutzomyia longipalpis TaxID=7200 RepID=A0A1B0CMB6_LUTLO
MNLASIETAEEQTLMASLLDTIEEDPWMGAYNYEKDQIWRWIATGKPLIYTNWNTGEPNNRDEDTFIGENCTQIYGQTKAFPIGKWNDVHYQVKDRMWRWIATGKPVIYTNWQSGEPNNIDEPPRKGENCGQVTWFTAYYECEKYKMNLASIETAEEQTLITSLLNTIGEDPWIGAYNYEEDRMWRWIATGKPVVSWFQAYYMCNEYKMNLASIETAEEQKLVTSFTVIVEQELWIGAYSYEKDRMWRWIATGEPVVYTNWNNGEPNDLNEIEHYFEYCVFVYGPPTSHIKGRWNDENCFKKHYFVCERRFE